MKLFIFHKNTISNTITRQLITVGDISRP